VFFVAADNESYTVAIIKPDVVAHGKADEIIMKVRAQFKGQEVRSLLTGHLVVSNLYAVFC